MTVNELPKLNLPTYDVQLRATEGEVLEIYDILRQKWIVLTPEEWVRQHFVHHLLDHFGYSCHRMANEISLKLNNTLRRCDTVVYDDFMQPLVIIEYKASHIQITQNVFDQIARYNMVLGARYLIVSNGLNHYCCRIDDGKVTFLRNIPEYNSIRLSGG
jgi:hypothetical protein